MSYLVKIGGSLIPSCVYKLYKALKSFARESPQKIFLFPGGGEFADLIRKYRKTLSLCDETTHKMALVCLDQNAYLIADICKCKVVSTRQELKSIREFPAVIAPYQLMREARPFEAYNLNIDTLSSDSSAVYAAYLLRSVLIIATDVDGVYERDPKAAKRKPKLLKEISAKALNRIKGAGPLDETIPKLIDKYKMKTWVVNGKYPSRILQIIKDKNLVRGTLIRPKG